MSLTNPAKSEHREFDMVEAGVYAARFSVICGQGDQIIEYNGEKSVKDRAFWNFELLLTSKIVDQQVVVERCRRHESGERPLSIGERWTVTAHPKGNISVRLHQLSRGKAVDMAKFDFRRLVGQPCKLTIVHRPRLNDPTTLWAAIEKLEQYDRDLFGEVCPAAEEPPIYFDWDMDDASAEFQRLPEWLQSYARPAAAEEIAAVRGVALGAGPSNSDVHTEITRATEAVRSPTVTMPLQDLDDDIPF